MSYLNKIILISFLSLVISGCGFELRGYKASQLAQVNLLINASDILANDISYRHFERVFKRDLENRGANIASASIQNSQLENALQINLHNLTFSTQGIGRDGTGRANEHEITARLGYQLNFASDKPVENEMSFLFLTASASYFQDYRNPAAGEVQKKQTQILLMQQLSQNLIRQIEFELTPK